MEYISSFIYCDSIQPYITNEGQKFNPVDPLQILMPYAIPGNYSFSISCTISGFDTSKENKVRLKFLSPSGTIMNDTGELTIQPNKENDNIEGTMQLNLDMRNMLFMEEGVHATIIYANDKEIGTYKINVKKRT